MALAPYRHIDVKLQKHSKGLRKKIGFLAPRRPKCWYWPTIVNMEKAKQQAWGVMVIWDARKWVWANTDHVSEPLTWHTPVPTDLVVQRLQNQFHHTYHASTHWMMDRILARALDVPWPKLR